MLKDRAAKVARQWWPQHRRIGFDLAIITGQIGNDVGRRATVADGLLAARLNDVQRLRPERHPGHTGNRQRTERGAADDDAAPETDDAAGTGPQHQPLWCDLLRRRRRLRSHGNDIVSLCAVGGRVFARAHFRVPSTPASVRRMRTTCCGFSPRRSSAAPKSRSTI